PDLFDIVSPATHGDGHDELAVELPAADANALAALARRVAIPSAAIWRAAWAITLARLAGVERARIGRVVREGVDTVASIDVPRTGELAAWLATAAVAGAPNGAAKPAPFGAAKPASDAPQSAWSDIGRADGHALVWWSDDGRATARFDRSRIDRATVARL